MWQCTQLPACSLLSSAGAPGLTCLGAGSKHGAEMADDSDHGLGKTLLGLADALLFRGRVSTMLCVAYSCQSQYCMCASVSSVLLHLCRHISVPRQVSGELFCSKDTEFLVLHCAMQPKMFVPVILFCDFHTEGITQTR